MQDGLTIRQDRLADYLLDPRIRTQREAGRLAGYSDTAALDSIVSIAIRNEKFIEALDRRRREGSDNGPGYRALTRKLNRILEKATTRLGELLEEPEKLDLQTAGALTNLSGDLLVKLAKLHELEGDGDREQERSEARRQWMETVRYAYTLGVAAARLLGVARASELAVTVPSRIERRLILRGSKR